MHRWSPPCDEISAGNTVARSNYVSIPSAGGCELGTAMDCGVDLVEQNFFAPFFIVGQRTWHFEESDSTLVPDCGQWTPSVASRILREGPKFHSPPFSHSNAAARSLLFLAQVTAWAAKGCQAAKGCRLVQLKPEQLPPETWALHRSDHPRSREEIPYIYYKDPS